MAASDLVNLSGLMDDAKCFALVRQHRWPEGICCPGCNSPSVIRDGCDDTQPHRQRYRCKACASRFDDLTGTVLAGHHQPLRVWVLCLYLASRPGEFHPQALLEPCLNLSVHTAPDVRPLTCSTRQCANRAGFARCIRANQSRAPFGRGRRRLYLFRAQRIR